MSRKRPELDPIIVVSTDKECSIDPSKCKVLESAGNQCQPPVKSQVLGDYGLSHNFVSFPVKLKTAVG